MANTILKLLLIGVTVIFLSIGCTEEINLKLASTPPRLVVDGVLTTNANSNYVRLSLSSEYGNDYQTPRVSGAMVMVDDGLESIYLIESASIDGLYLFPHGYRGVAGRTYKLSVEVVDDGEVQFFEAESVMPAIHHLDSIGYLFKAKDKEWRIQYYGKDNPDTKDFYMFQVAKNDSLISDQYSEMITVNDELFNGNDFNGVVVYVIREEDRDGKQVLSIAPNDTIELFVCGITEEFFTFINGLTSEVGFKNPVFGGTQANLKGNISNGALGFFNTYSVVSSHKVVTSR